MAIEEVKRCPYCGEEILAIAIKCKHCASNLRGAVSQAVAVSPGAVAVTTDLGWALLGVPLAGTMLLWSWVTNLAMIQGPGSAATLIVVGVVISTAALVAIEANKLGMTADNAAGTYSPTQWMFMCVFLWVVGYPTYLFKRRHYGRSNLLVGGLVVALVFVGSAFCVGKLIEDQNAEFHARLNKLQDTQQTITTQKPFEHDSGNQGDTPAPTAVPGPSPKPASAPKALTPRKIAAGWTVHVGSFATEADAERFRRQLEGQGFNAYLLPVGTADSKRYRVLLGPIANSNEADETIAKLRTYGHAATLVPPRE